MHSVQAQNHAEESENRIHSDDIAQRLGFTGALVPGVAVYGYMMRAAANPTYLANSNASVRFLKPAYHGDWLEIGETDSGYACRNGQGTVLATLDVRDGAGPAQDHTVFSNVPVAPERTPIAWDTIETGRPFDPWLWHTDAERNAEYAAQVSDDAALWQEFVHPHWLLSIANTVLTRQFEMPAWIHVGSEIHHRAAVRVGEDITVQGAALEKWRKKGHEFVRLLIRYQRGDIVTTDILHTAIYRIAGA